MALTILRQMGGHVTLEFSRQEGQLCTFALEFVASCS